MNVKPIFSCLFLGLFLFACAPRPQPTAATPQRDDLVDMARARPVPEILQGRFHIKLRSKQLDIAGSTGGGLVVERPGKGHLAILGPLGGPLLTTTSDGEAMGVMIAKEKRYLVAEDAEQVLSKTTSGAAGMDDVLALLVGDLPFDNSEIASTDLVDGVGRRVTFNGPVGSSVEVVLRDVDGTLQSLRALDEQKELVLEARYGEYQEVAGQLMPVDVSLRVPDLDLTVEIRYKNWSFPETAPDVFGVTAPEGMKQDSLNDVVTKLVESKLTEASTKKTD